MNTYRIIGIYLLILILTGPVEVYSAGWDPNFYAYCVEVGVPGVKPHSFPDQVKLLKEIGFDGTGYAIRLGDDMEKNLKILDDAGVHGYIFWASINLKAEKGKVYDQRLPAAISKLKGRRATVCVLLGGFKPGDPGGMDSAAKVLRELGDMAAEAGVRISIYNHVGNWTESLPFVVEVIRKVDHPQVGFNFNLCHWLKVDGKSDYRPLLRDNVNKLFVVTINGAQVDAKAWTNGLIQPLDKGNFDNGQLLNFLSEIGYKGPVGLMCYGVPDDTRDHLVRSMTTWRKLKEKIK
ncbi:MAG: TIM barrel protein [Kiritimatiellae bacterium]|nr:TIM barrel protein [Kiritimatiellia bacterium]MDD5519822.1 TIM barrel protein [Kiritimatiellia bacterium]